MKPSSATPISPIYPQLAGDLEYENLKAWRLENVPTKRIAELYAQRFGVQIRYAVTIVFLVTKLFSRNAFYLTKQYFILFASLRSLERKLQHYELQQNRDEDVSNQQILHAVQVILPFVKYILQLFLSSIAWMLGGT